MTEAAKKVQGWAVDDVGNWYETLVLEGEAGFYEMPGEEFQFQEAKELVTEELVAEEFVE